MQVLLLRDRASVGFGLWWHAVVASKGTYRPDGTLCASADDCAIAIADWI